MKFYRYELQEYAEHDIDGELCSPRFPNPKLHLRELNLYKETPKGYWIGYASLEYGKIHSKGTWIPKVSKKRYAYPTRKEALNNFIKRTDKRIKILKWQLEVCKIGINLALNIKLP